MALGLERSGRRACGGWATRPSEFGMGPKSRNAKTANTTTRNELFTVTLPGCDGEWELGFVRPKLEKLAVRARMPYPTGNICQTVNNRLHGKAFLASRRPILSRFGGGT